MTEYFSYIKQFGNDIGWLSNIFGIGVFAFILFIFKFAKKIKQLQWFLKQKKNAKNLNLNVGEFSIGAVSDRFILVEGNGVESFKQIKTKEIPTSISLPDEVKEQVKLISHELENQEANHFKLYDGDIYSFTAYRISRTQDDESICIELDFHHSKYYEFLAVDKLVRDPLFRQTHFAESIEAKKPKYCLGFGICLTLITSDNKLIVPRRSENVSVWKNKLTISANEALSRKLDRNENGQPDVYFAAKRAAKEELGIDVDLDAIRFYGLGFETISLQWALFATAKIDLSVKEVEESFLITAKDRFEHSELLFVEFTSKSIIKFIKDRGDEMVPSAKAQFILSLINNNVSIEELRRNIIDIC